MSNEDTLSFENKACEWPLMRIVKKNSEKTSVTINVIFWEKQIITEICTILCLPTFN